MSQDPETRVHAAAILKDGSADVDALLGEFAARQRAAGRRVRGLVMTRPGTDRTCAAPMVLVDVDSGEQFLVSQPLGGASGSCRADPQGFARASRVLRDAAGQAPDLVISDRFGSLESEGGGFAAELLALMAEGVPVLTAVAPAHAEAWQRFSGDAGLLPPRAEALAAWLETALGERAAGTPAAEQRALAA
ncbi:MAG: DUF2478 domain-containing protein [Burkholderiales bacterium]|nr:DUF2478 domain-containing protein [Burkholderiales bacterium]MDE2455257.1 DUF2478 domain-containing protein [Burkholderiales bacterium]